MFIKIEVDTREPLSDQDKAVLLALTGQAGAATPTADAPPAAAKKAAPAKKAAAKKAAPAQGAPPAAQDDAQEDLRDQAVARASELLQAGHRDRVMAALKDAGAGRVSEVDADALPAFIEALED
jgi:hypothetical protein